MPKPNPKPKATPKSKRQSEEDAYFADLQKRMKPRLEAKPVSPFAPRVDPAEEARKKMQARSNKRLDDVSKKGLGGRRKAIDRLF
jgi:hypothetical protein